MTESADGGGWRLRYYISVHKGEKEALHSELHFLFTPEMEW